MAVDALNCVVVEIATATATAMWCAEGLLAVAVAAVGACGSGWVAVAGCGVAVELLMGCIDGVMR
jgi:hypothetical protein